MAEDLNDFLAARGPVAGRPLLGLTVLVVEDSRFACEAMRLLCLRSGARIRRADCLRSARRHLQTYRPTIVIIDMGLPDGSGADLIADLAAMTPRVAVILGTSGSADLADAAIRAGADGFLPKPIESLAGFQQMILTALPEGPASPARATEVGDKIAPDPMALRDDLVHAAQLLDGAPTKATLDYVSQFLSGVALSAHDAALGDAARALGRMPGRGLGLQDLNRLVSDRLASGSRF